jgi:hypothetical protein
MAIKNKTELKSLFETNKYPTQQDFHDLIDSAFDEKDLPTQTSTNVDQVLISTDGVSEWKFGDYILDVALEENNAGSSIDNPYIAGTHGESRLVLRDSTDTGLSYYIMLPPTSYNLFIEDQIYQVDTSLASPPIYVFAHPDTGFSRGISRIIGNYLGTDVNGYIMDKMNHYTFEAYPSQNTWVPINHTALLLKEASTSEDGWGNDPVVTTDGGLCRYTLSQEEYTTLLNLTKFIGPLNTVETDLHGRFIIPRGYKTYILNNSGEQNFILNPNGSSTFQVNDEIQIVNEESISYLYIDDTLIYPGGISAVTANILQGYSMCTLKLTPIGWVVISSNGTISWDD